jgi:hypothetical protein
MGQVLQVPCFQGGSSRVMGGVDHNTTRQYYFEKPTDGWIQCRDLPSKGIMLEVLLVSSRMSRGMSFSEDKRTKMNRPVIKIIFSNGMKRQKCGPHEKRLPSPEDMPVPQPSSTSAVAKMLVELSTHEARPVIFLSIFF